MKRMSYLSNDPARPYIIIDSFNNIIKNNYNAAETIAFQLKNLNDLY